MTKDAIHDGLFKFFGGDEAKVEGALNAIKDGLKVKVEVFNSIPGMIQ